jgi:hypothetical protein
MKVNSECFRAQMTCEAAQAPSASIFAALSIWHSVASILPRGFLWFHTTNWPEKPETKKDISFPAKNCR